MNLPWLSLQTAYAHLAWAVVLAACGVGVIAWKKPLRVRWAAAWVVATVVLCALPGPASPSFWLSLAFHLPSPMLLICCWLAVWAHAHGRVGHRVMPLGMALAMAGAGAALYADTAGWLYLGLYMRGFGSEAAFTGLMVASAALVVLSSGTNREVCLAVMLSILLFAVCRLPTGNVWDALFDPLLWLWSLFSLLARATAWLRTARSSPQTA